MADRHNLVVILSDQQRYDTMACYGNDWIQTPRLNALADESFVFEAPYVTQPVCTPSRVSLLTGLYPHAAGPIMNKMRLDPDIPVIAEMVSEEYHCGYYGKWHLGYALAPQHGFTDWVSTQGGPREPLHSPRLRIRPEPRFRTYPYIPHTPRGVTLKIGTFFKKTSKS